MISSKQLMKRVGATYRQIDHWSRVGYLESAGENRPGSGVTRYHPDSEITVARLLRALAASDMLGSTGAGRQSDYLPRLIAHVREHGLIGDYEISDVHTIHLGSIRERVPS